MRRAEAEGPDALHAAKQAGLMAVDRDPARAADAFRRAVALAPQDAEALLCLARLDLARGQIDSAVALAGEAFAVAREPDLRGHAAFALGEAALAQGDPTRARDAFEAGAALFKSWNGSDEAKRCAARCAQRLADLAPDARAAHLKALAQIEALDLAACGPALLADAAFGHERLAKLSRAAGDVALALKHATRARQCRAGAADGYPHDPAVKPALAAALILEGRCALDAAAVDAAVQRAQDALAVALPLAARGGDQTIAAQAWTLLSEGARLAKTLNLALSAADQACALWTAKADAPSSEIAQAFTARAAARFDAGDIAGAEADAERAGGAGESGEIAARAWAVRAEIAKRAGRADEYVRALSACADAWLQTVTTAPQRRDAVAALAQILLALGEAHRALRNIGPAASAFRDALSMAELLCDRDDPAALRLRARLCAALMPPNPGPADPFRAKGLASLETLTRLGALTADDVDLQAKLLGLA